MLLDFTYMLHLYCPWQLYYYSLYSWASPFFMYKYLQAHVKSLRGFSCVIKFESTCCQTKSFWFTWHKLLPLLFVEKFSSNLQMCKIRYSSSNDLTFEDFIDCLKQWKYEMKLSWLSLTWSIFPSLKDFRRRLQFRAKIFSHYYLKIKKLSYCSINGNLIIGDIVFIRIIQTFLYLKWTLIITI